MAKYVVTISDTDEVNIVKVSASEEVGISQERIEKCVQGFDNWLELRGGKFTIRIFVNQFDKCYNFKYNKILNRSLNRNRDQSSPIADYKGNAIVCFGSRSIGINSGLPMDYDDAKALCQFLRRFKD